MPSKNDFIRQLPRHVAFIMDGNRRWAKKKELKISDGHKKGSEIVKSIVKKSIELEIKYLTYRELESK